MKFTAEIKKALKKISENRFDSFFIFFQLVVFVGMIRQFSTDVFLVINLVLVFGLSLANKRLSFKGMPTVLLLFTLIVLPALLIWGISYFQIYVGFYIRFLTACFLISYFRYSFFELFENILFLLALISIPFFFMQIIYIEFFNLFQGFSEMVLSDIRLNYGWGVLSGHQYFVFFGVNSWAELRNSGFAWEPAGFGAMLVWASLANLFICRMQLNFRLIVFFIAAITTFSVGTYITYIVLILFFLYNARPLKRISYGIVISLTLIAVFSISFFLDMSDYMLGKTENYIESLDNTGRFDRDPEAKRNRVQGFFEGTKLITKSPFGYGLAPSEKTDLMYSSNGFINIMLKYGVLGGILLFYLLSFNFKFLKWLYHDKMRGKWFFIAVLLLTYNGSPFYHQPFFLASLFFGWLNFRYIKTSYMSIKNLNYI